VDLPLFVYGTLRGGCDNEFARLLHSVSDFVINGRLRGSLYRIAHYPGCVEDSDGWVTGEIWQPRDSVSIIEKLDAYEGAEYRRVARSIETSSGLTECWVYLYADPVAGKPRILSGDWLVQ